MWQSAAAAHEEESQKLNRLLCEHASGNQFASMFWCVYDEPLNSLRYVNAGHCPPFLISNRGGNHAFVACGPDNYVAVLDLKTLEVTGHIDVGGEPDGLAWAIRANLR
jgi:YVTN family beta-propeller protein